MRTKCTQGLDLIITKGCLVFIKIYQKTLSFDHAWFGKYFPYRGCKFYPSCSQYAKETLIAIGFFRGIRHIIWRLMRCHPWSDGGIDLPPRK